MSTKNEIALNPSSRKVTIFRKKSFVDEAQQGEGGAAEFLSMSKQPIGSYWSKSTSKQIGSGLDFKEQAILMPELVGADPTDRNFREKCADYFNNLRTPVDYIKGVTLEIGLLDNSKPLGETIELAGAKMFNLPLDPAEYVAYRHAKGHPQVAESEAAGKGDMLKLYYIFDPVAAEKLQVDATDSKEDAFELWMKIKKEDEGAKKEGAELWTKADMMLTLLGTDFRTLTAGSAAATTKLRREKLRELADKDPRKFLDTYKETLFEEYFTIQNMINTGVLKLNGEFVNDPASGTTIGHNMKEAAIWLKDPHNGQTVLLLKQKVNEAMNTSSATRKLAGAK